jgi:multidrug efflux pump subunit AcrA (membrane-fusion protein)
VLLTIIFSIFFGTENIEKKKLEEINIISENQEDFLTISELKTEGKNITIYGKTESKSQVDVFAQSPDIVKKINFKLGDYVSAGQIIIELDSRIERSNYNQAKINFDSANYSHQKLAGGSDKNDLDNLENNLEINKNNLEKLKRDIESETNKLLIFLDSVLRNEIDDFFDHTDPEKSIYNPTFTYRLKSETEIEKLEDERKELNNYFETYKKNIFQSSTKEKNINSIEILNNFLQLSENIQKQSQDFIGFSDKEIESLEAKTLLTKNNIETKKEIFKNLKISLENQKTTINISENNLEKSENGADIEDIAISNLNISTRYESLKNAQTILSKKILRAPISGKITSINADLGKLSSNSSSIFSIHNSKNLKIIAKISQENISDIFVGKKILVNDISAKIISVSSIMNSQGSIDFEAEFSENNNLISGESVKIKIQKEVSGKDNFISLPISAIFEKNEEYFIYILNKESRTEETKVLFEKIDGDKIIIKNTFSGNEKILKNSRGISNNQKI